MRAVLPVLLALAQTPGEPRPREELLILYGVEDETLESRMREEVQSLGSWRFESVRLLEARSARREDLAGGALALVGTPASNSWLEELARDLPVGLGRDGFRLASERFDDRADSLSLRGRNPLSPSSPLLLVAGNSDEAVLDALRKRRRSDVHLRRRGKTVLLGRLDSNLELDPGAVRRFSRASAPSLSRERFDYFVHGFSEARLEEFASGNEELLRRVEALFGPLPNRRLEVHLYPSLEEKGLVTDDTRVAHLEGDALYAVLGIDRAPARLLAEHLLDIPDAFLRRGLATVLVSDDEELDRLERTALRLSRTSEPPVLSWRERESPYVVEAVSASFARFALARRGARWFRSPEPAIDSLERDFWENLDRIAPASPSVPSPPASFLRGFTYAHEGYNIDDGYLSARSERSLERLSRLGIDAVAIVPYTFMRDPKEIAPLSVPERPGSETDEDVTHAIATAKAKGMSVLLKPQIWIRRSWPGEIEAVTPADEERFFREYGRWIRHYALMAERHGVEILAIGTELSKMTVGRKARWERLIADLRSVYSGKLVYAANWGAEVEQVEFWPLLDFIGVDFYYPLSEHDSPSDEELRRGFERALDAVRGVSRRHGRPVLLTEIGYASTRRPWKSPHSSDREEELSPEDQAKAYEIAFAALEDERGWIRGMYWWKWPTDLENGGPDHSGFTPAGKPAEEVVRIWYRDRLQ